MPTACAIDWVEPERLFVALSGRPHRFWLDSALVDARLGGRWSYLGADPATVVELRDGVVWRNGERLARAGDPLAQALAAIQPSPGQLPGPALPVPFRAGIVGYLGYDLGPFLEPGLPPPRVDRPCLPDLVLADYPVIAAFDHATRRAWLVQRQGADGAAAPEERLATLRRGLAAAPPLDPITIAPPVLVSDLVCNLGPAAFRAAVARAIEAVLDGEIFQANLARRYRGTLRDGIDPATLYRSLRRISPTPFAAYLDLGHERAILSASPERFLRVAGGLVETRPIKGTRPRGATPQADAALARELLESEKDRAENVMIVDLLRNDLLRSCAAGSVEVRELCALHSFPRVHHLVSTVTGRTAADPLDVLLRAFPGGSITGAPKIRAMQLIRELEPDPRGPYCGTILWFDGASLDSSIVIRTLLVDGRCVTFHAGAGITASSDPTAEDEETRVKAGPLLALLAGART